MSSENNDKNLETMPEVPEVPKVRKMRGPGKKPIKLTQDPKYHADYWMAKRSIKTPCGNCGRTVVIGKMYRHIQTPLCKRHSKDPEEVQKIKDEFYANQRCSMNVVFSELD